MSHEARLKIKSHLKKVPKWHLLLLSNTQLWSHRSPRSMHSVCIVTHELWCRLTHIHLSHTKTYCTLTLSSLPPSSISPAGRLLCLTGGVCPCKHPANSARQSKCFRKMIGCHESRGLVLSVRLTYYSLQVDLNSVEVCFREHTV